MFGKKSLDLSRLSDDQAQTVISATTTLTGTIKADGVLIIHGRVEGEIETAGSVLIGKQGQIQGQIEAQAVAVAGAVVGNIIAAERIEITSTGKVLGDITTGCLVIDEGGFFHGHSTMSDRQSARLEAAENAA